MCMHGEAINFYSCPECYKMAYEYKPDGNITLSQAMSESYSNAKEKGFHNVNQSFGDKMMLAVSELAEALEEYRNGCGVQTIYFVLDSEGKPKPEGVPIEIIDCMIRLFDNCGYYNIPITQIYMLKTEYNKSRPHLHGNKKL